MEKNKLFNNFFIFVYFLSLALVKLGFKIENYYLSLILYFKRPKFKTIYFWRLHDFRIKPFSLITLKIKYFILGFIFCLLFIGSDRAIAFVHALPSPTAIGKVNYPLSTHLYDRNGKLLYEFYHDQNRTPVKLKDLPEYVYKASIAIEDKDFYRHNGISPISGILRAIKDMIIYKNLQGGSTITQQLVKSALLTPERTFERKIKELILALWTERLYSKDKILEMYLNQVPYGGSAYGIEEASKTYFNKSAKDLTLSEAALLAGLPQAPSLYSPFVNPELALKRRDSVLTKMKEQNYISEDEKTNAINEKFSIILPTTTIEAPHFVFYVKNEIEKIYGSRQVEEGGLRVMTTLDLEIQKKAETILKEELEKVKFLNINNGAILITRPKTGEILTMIGSVDYFAQPFGAFNVVTALRQPGSSIKPLMYSLALQKGFTAGTVIDDWPIVFNIPGGEPYRPVNYDGRFHGKVTLRYALANSYNIPAVKTLNALGVNNFLEYAQKLGISSWNEPGRYGLSLTLGGGEVKMSDMAVAFGSFANLGEKIGLNSIVKMDNSDNQQLDDIVIDKSKTMPEGVAFIISDILSDNQARIQAFGPNSLLEIPGYKVAVKTGTTDEKKDNWTIGYTPEFLVAVWVGNNDNTPMNPILTSGVTGAAPIWNRVMTMVLKNYGEEKKWFIKPQDVVEKNCNGKVEYFISGTENSINCNFQITPTSEFH